MGKEQDLLLAVKNGDLPLAHKLLAKIKTNRNSELFYGTCFSQSYVQFF